MKKIPNGKFRLSFILGTILAASNAFGQYGSDMQTLLQPYLTPGYNPPSGPDSNRPAIAVTATNIQLALPASLTAPVTVKRHLLVLTFQTFGTLHSAGAGGFLEMLRYAAAKYNSAFDLTERYDITGIDTNYLSQFDAVVLNDISQWASWYPNEDIFYNQTLPAYVLNGGGLLAIHGVGLIFYAYPDKTFNKMLGSCTMDSPELWYTVHPLPTGNWNHLSPYAVKVMEPQNPLAAGFYEQGAPFTLDSCQLDASGSNRIDTLVSISPPQVLADELYVINPNINADKSARAIFSVDQDKVPRASFPGANDFSYSLAWIKNYGKGRVFYTQWGHNQAVFAIPFVSRAILDGLQFVTGDLTVPDCASRAVFSGSDTSTEGNWSPSYGKDGYVLAQGSLGWQTLATYVTGKVSGETNGTWNPPYDYRALLLPGGTNRLAASWSATNTFYLDLNFTDEQAHQLALYALDWDSNARGETISILDANNNVLDTETVSGFHTGTYLIWQVKGHVKVQVTNTSGSSAVLSGIFLDPTALNATSKWFFNNDLPLNGTGKGAWIASPAGDGISNLAKCALDISAKMTGYQGNYYTGTVTDSNGVNYMSISYEQPEPAPVPATVDASSDLISWSSTGTVLVSSNVVGVQRLNTVRDSIPFGATPHRFMRLKLSTP